jgi:hypothetical protein
MAMSARSEPTMEERGCGLKARDPVAFGRARGSPFDSARILPIKSMGSSVNLREGCRNGRLYVSPRRYKVKAHKEDGSSSGPI